MKLADYLNAFSWSQADLAREADISTQTVARALKGHVIARRNANAIVTAINRRWQLGGGKGHISLASIRGLKVAELQRSGSKKPKHSTQEELPEGLIADPGQNTHQNS